MTQPLAGLGVVLMRERLFLGLGTRDTPLTRYLEANGARTETVFLRRLDHFGYQGDSKPFPKPVEEAVRKLRDDGSNHVALLGFRWTADIAVRGALLFSKRDYPERMDGAVGINPGLECFCDFPELASVTNQHYLSPIKIPLLDQLSIPTLLMLGAYDNVGDTSPTVRRLINWSGRPNVRIRTYDFVDKPLLRGWFAGKMTSELRGTLLNHLEWVAGRKEQTAIDPIVLEQRRDVAPLGMVHV